MDFKTLISNIIEEEISALERDGENVRLKTLIKKRILYTVICGALFLLFTAATVLVPAFIVMIVYFVLMYRANNVSVITALAKKSPDTPIAEIIKGDMK